MPYEYTTNITKNTHNPTEHHIVHRHPSLVLCPSPLTPFALDLPPPKIATHVTALTPSAVAVSSQQVVKPVPPRRPPLSPVALRQRWMTQ